MASTFRHCPTRRSPGSASSSRRSPISATRYTGRPAETFGAVLDAVATADGIDLTALYLLHEPDAVDPLAILDGHDHPTVLSLTVVAGDPCCVARGSWRGWRPVLPTPERAARAVAAVVRDAQGRHRRAFRAATATQPATTVAPEAAGWDEVSAKRLVEELGLETPARIVCDTHDQARAAIGELSAPFVVKLLHPDVAHKTEAGGVHLGVRDEAELGRALAAIDRTPGARYLIEETAPSGPELLLGAKRDSPSARLSCLAPAEQQPRSTPTAAVRLAPLDAVEAAGMLGELAGAARFRGHRGTAAVDERQLAGRDRRLRLADRVARRHPRARGESAPRDRTRSDCARRARRCPVTEHPSDRRVIVVGAGPVGLTAALVLRAAGVPVTVVEAGALDRVRAGSRGSSSTASR